MSSNNETVIFNIEESCCDQTNSVKQICVNDFEVTFKIIHNKKIKNCVVRGKMM